MHESCDVGDGDDDVDHDEDGGDEVCQEEERRQEHAQLQEDYTANWICSVIHPVSRKQGSFKYYKEHFQLNSTKYRTFRPNIQIFEHRMVCLGKDRSLHV